jgi:hypothetical protein
MALCNRTGSMDLFFVNYCLDPDFITCSKYICFIAPEPSFRGYNQIIISDYQKIGNN